MHRINDTIVVDAGIRDLRPDVLDAAGRLRILPAAFWRGTTTLERAVVGARIGAYNFPTVELVEHLRALIGDRSAIEIGAGNGVLADALGIPGTDSRQHELPEYALTYNNGPEGTAPTPYGPNIVHLDAAAAVRRYRPDVVIACWVTHKYNPANHWAKGNERGVNERAVIDATRLYVFVGNETVHARKPIWRLPHGITYPEFVYSCAHRPGREFIATWGH